MQFAEPWLFVLCVAALLVVLGATAGLVNNRLWISEPLACTAVGVALGYFGLPHLSPGLSSAASPLLREAARVTLAIAVRGAAMRIPRGWARGHWAGLAVALGPGMLAMWMAGSVIAAAAFGWPALTCLLVGAAIAPTDPVLARPSCRADSARDHIPADLRHALTAESGANDGLALPFVIFPIELLGHPPGQALLRWRSTSCCGRSARWWRSAAPPGGSRACLNWAARRKDAEPASLLSVALALALTTLAAARVLDGDGILAAFVAGLVLNQGIQGEAEERQERFNEALGRFFDLPVLVLFGAVIPWEGWTALGWRGLGFAVAVLLFRRPPAWFALRRFMPWLRRPSHAVFAGWFGPVGVAALFYACEAQARTGLPGVWPAVSLVIASSILAHGVTGTPLTRLLRAETRDRPSGEGAANSGGGAGAGRP